ncbi:MAG: DUF1294 domain-containing protein [Clostridium sp.]|nr:DUF1294 domain-containing protein [Erysipelotrichaceae bacterium]
MLLVFLWNAFTFCMMGIDKWKAIHRHYRISERFLIFCSIAFGALGTAFGMIIFHHKIRKPKFLCTIPVLCFLQLILYWLVFID